MLRCQTMPHYSSLCFIRKSRNQQLRNNKVSYIKPSNKKAEDLSAFLFDAISEINSAQMALRQQTNGATCLTSYLPFGTNRQDARRL